MILSSRESGGLGVRNAFRLALVAGLVSVAACAGTKLPVPVYPNGEAVLAPGVEEDPDVREIRGQYARMARAFAAQTVDTIASIRTADFYAVFPSGDRHEAAQMLDVLKHFFVQNKPPIRVWYTLRSASRTGPDEIAIETFQQGSRYQDLAGRRRKVEHDVMQRETWRHEGGVWRFCAVDSIRNPHRWVDGKPIDPSRPYDPKAPPYQAPAQ